MDKIIHMKKPLKYSEENYLRYKLHKEGMPKKEIENHIKELKKIIKKNHKIEKNRIRDNKLIFKEEFDKLMKK